MTKNGVQNTSFTKAFSYLYIIAFYSPAPLFRLLIPASTGPRHFYSVCVFKVWFFI